jgi:hypothetical protein
MKNIPLLAFALLALTSCSVKNSNTAKDQQADTTKTDTTTSSNAKVLVADMQIQDTLRSADSLILTFTVRNHTAAPLRFCKWHTPFEPLMSKYLDIKDVNGVSTVDYRGAMAKRIMPPPESSYMTLQPADSAKVRVDLRKGYAITNPGKYSIKYEGEGISGLVVKDSVTFVYLP